MGASYRTGTGPGPISDSAARLDAGTHSVSTRGTDSMSGHSPRIRIPRPRGGGLAVREGLSLCFYMGRTHRELGGAVSRALEVYRGAVGPSALAWYGDDQEDWRELDERGWEFIRQELLAPDFAFVELRDVLEGAGQFRFSYQGRWLDDPRAAPAPDKMSAVCFWLSTEYLEARGPARVHALALALARELPFDSGHAGLAFNAEEGLGALQAVREVCFRYPGLDIPDSALASLDLGTRVRGVHWVNLLGSRVLKELGGVEALRSRLSSPDTLVERLGEERAIITLGPRPEAGDTEQGLLLPAWRELARVLEPWLYHRPLPFLSFSEADTLRWERRFLEPRSHA
jgi:hypothetical protein